MDSDFDFSDTSPKKSKKNDTSMLSGPMVLFFIQGVLILLLAINRSAWIQKDQKNILLTETQIYILMGAFVAGLLLVWFLQSRKYTIIASLLSITPIFAIIGWTIYDAYETKKDMSAPSS